MNKEEITFKEKNGEDLLYFEQLIQNYSKSQLAEANIELQQENKKLKEVIDKAIDYLETKRIREKAIIDIDVLEGILKEVE